MNAYEKRQHQAHERLHISNHAYSLKHVQNIALQLFKMHSHFCGFDIATCHDQNRIASWIASAHTHDEIAVAERIVRSNYSGKQQLFRKGRKVGSTNRSTSDGLDDVLGASSFEATHAATSAETRTSDEARASSGDMSVYALKSELQSVAGALTNALKDYCESNFKAGRSAVSLLQNELESLQARVASITDNRPTVVTIERANLPNIELGTQHKHMPRLLKMCNAALRSGSHLNIWLYGPAGTGKSTAAEIVAKALGLDFYTNGKLATEYAVLGFINTTGYQTTEFRKAFENGGIYLADEIDGSMPDALLALNGALANGHCVFPDKVVKRHSNFIFIAAANTTGTGATIDYVGRFKQDAAFNDRFVFLDWPLDEGLEDSMVADKVWLQRVRQIRVNIARVGIKGHLITPRASLYGEALLAAGLTMQEVEEATLKKGLSAAQWSQVK